jgi:diguanylate cyclase (GGDEF)-like protein/PAS domain S-box-containing protein
MPIINRKKPFNLTISTKLLLGALLTGIVLLWLSFGGSLVISESEERVDKLLQNQVRPLVMVNNLQSQLDGIRIVEIGIPQLEDFFAVNTEVETLAVQVESFEQELKKFLQLLESAEPTTVSSIHSEWAFYRSDLERVIDAGAEMQLKEVERISRFSSEPRFRALAEGLYKLAGVVEREANASQAAAKEKTATQRLFFWTTALVTLFVLAILTWMISRSLSYRVHVLRKAANRVAEGLDHRTIDIQGNDELSDLAHAFNTMQERVIARETALKEIQDELEDRVAKRTEELYYSNKQLRLEIEERKRSEDTLRLLSKAVEQSPVTVVITDTDATIEYVNDAFVHTSGYSRDEAIGQNPRLLQSGQTDEGLYRKLWSNIKQGREWSGELLNKRKSGELFWEQVTISPVTNEQSQITHYLAVKEDITLRKAQEEKIRYQAQYDALTDLPNRTLAMDRLSQMLIKGDRYGEKVALLYIDLDDFKKINDSLGHEFGDRMLVHVAERLRSSVRGEDTVARHGGDEFLIIMGSLHDSFDLETVLNTIVNAFARPFNIDNRDLVISPSVGVSIYPNDGKDPGALLRSADHALYQAKDDGGNAYCYYNQEIHQDVVKRLDLERHLRKALELGELQLHYQPLFDAHSGDLYGTEALLRWNSHKFGFMPPDRFISVAEHTGLIIEIGEWVLQTASRQVSAWQQQTGHPLRLAVNVSPRQFRDKRILESVGNAISLTSFDPRLLHVEITEGMLIRNRPEIQETLEELDCMGIHLTMDDFGTGYSSLSYLKNYPFRTLKIDRSFVRDIPADQDDCALVKAIITMGNELGLKIVAEGVETREQQDLLKDNGCHYLQGYYLGKPVPADQFERHWIHSQQAALGMSAVE